MTDVPSSQEADAEEPRWLRGIDLFNTVLAVVAALATGLLMLNVVADVLGRALLNQPLQGTLDLTQYAWMPSLVSLALGYALLRGEHIRVSLLTGPIGPTAQRVIEVVGMASTLIVVAFFIWFGTEKTFESMGTGEHALGGPWLIIWPFRALLILGMIGLFLQAFAQLFRAITAKEFVPADEDEAVMLLEQEDALIDEIDEIDDARHVQAKAGSEERR